VNLPGQCDSAVISFKDHFSTQAAVYAKARPLYPPALFAELARLAPGRALAWDCGAGNGQASVALAGHFERVVATEPSAAQLAEATLNPRVNYVQSAELAPGVADGSVDLVTAAQAAHWFDLEIFYPEVRRVARPGGLLAIWNYGLCSISPEVDAVVGHFYTETVGPYWPPERRHAETAYRLLEFPFPETPFPKLNIEVEWEVGEFATYLHTWSAVTRYTKARGNDPVMALMPELAQAWGPGRRRVVWPLGGRLGRVG
jgi:SAM-dependent methyltransferase